MLNNLNNSKIVNGMGRAGVNRAGVGTDMVVRGSNFILVGNNPINSSSGKLSVNGRNNFLNSNNWKFNNLKLNDSNKKNNNQYKFKGIINKRINKVNINIISKIIINKIILIQQKYKMNSVLINNKCIATNNSYRYFSSSSSCLSNKQYYENTNIRKGAIGYTSVFKLGHWFDFAPDTEDLLLVSTDPNFRVIVKRIDQWLKNLKEDKIYKVLISLIREISKIFEIKYTTKTISYDNK